MTKPTPEAIARRSTMPLAERTKMKLRPRLLKVAVAASLLTGAAAGPTAASPVDQAPSAAAPAPHGCNYYQFCIYANENYTVMVGRMSSCTWHRTPYFESYVNNQTRGTRARFYDSGRNLLSRTKPAPDKGTTPFNEETFYIRPC
jgi:hypothetical protein